MRAVGRGPVIAGIAVSGAILLTPGPTFAVEGDFTPGGSFPVGNTPYDIEVADFNRDGVPDAAVPNANGASVSIMLGDGLGRFEEAPGSPIATGQSPAAAAAGQFVGDNDLDLAVARRFDNSVLLLSGRGDGRFRRAAAGPIAVGGGPFELVAAYLNGDSDSDLVTANQDDDSLTVLLGDGSGLDEAGTSPESVGDSPQDLVAADLNGGAPDLAVVNAEDGTVSILLASGTGDFAAPMTSPETIGSGPIGIAAANLNAGGVRDLAVTGFANGGETHILLGNGLGDFTAAATSPEGDGEQDVLAADLDGDTDQDLATAHTNDGVAIMLNDGSADFTAAPSSPEDFPGLAADLATADLDGDADQDLLVAGGNSDNLHSYLNDEPDGDGDGIADQADDCPAVSGAGGCPQLDRKITISYSKSRGVFKGAITEAAEEVCERGETVKVFRALSQGGRKRVGTDRTNQAGRYRVGEDKADGRFYAEAKPSLEPDLGICAPATSDMIRVH